MKAVLARIKPLVLELHGLPDWPVTKLPAGLLLYDALIAQGATRAELEEILGREVMALVESPAVPDAGRPPSSQVC